MVTSRSTGSKADGFRTRFLTYLNDFCTTVTLYSRTETRDGMGRITEVTTTTTSIKADIQYVTKNDLLHLNVGQVQVGDGMLFVRYSETINLEDEVEFNNVRWRIMEQIEGELVEGQPVYKGYIIRKND